MLGACAIVNLNCLRLMNEHTAAALSYGIYKSAPERPIGGVGHRTTPRRRQEGAPIGNLYDLTVQAILLSLRTRPASRTAASTATRISV